jgi:hypothetical protein
MPPQNNGMPPNVADFIEYLGKLPGVNNVTPTGKQILNRCSVEELDEILGLISDYEDELDFTRQTSTLYKEALVIKNNRERKALVLSYRGGRRKSSGKSRRRRRKSQKRFY